MAKLSDKEASKTHRVMIFGAPKAGKSLLAAQLAEHYKLIWVDMENGHETLFQLPKAWQENIELIELKDTKSYPIAAETALKMVKKAVFVCDAHGKDNCMICKKQELTKEGSAPSVHIDLPNLGHDSVVVFDSLTQLTSSFISQITRGKPDEYKLQTDDWGDLAKLIDIFLSHLQQAGYNVIVISHEVESETEGKKKTLVPVGGSRNSSRNVAKFFDHVVYAERKNKKHVFSSSTCASTTILTGSRTGACLENGTGSLLEIFKPELFAGKEVDSATKVATTTKPAAGANVAGKSNNSSAAAMLAKIKARQTQ